MNNELVGLVSFPNQTYRIEDTTYIDTSAELYNILIRPIESQINAY